MNVTPTRSLPRPPSRTDRELDVALRIGPPAGRAFLLACGVRCKLETDCASLQSIGSGRGSCWPEVLILAVSMPRSDQRHAKRHAADGRASEPYPPYPKEKLEKPGLEAEMTQKPRWQAR